MSILILKKMNVELICLEENRKNGGNKFDDEKLKVKVLLKINSKEG